MKKINDVAKVIINVAACLKAAFRDGDIIFRLGGDEFAAYARNVHGRSAVTFAQI